MASMKHDNGDCSGSPWHLLPTTVQLYILSMLPPNERAVTSRLMSLAARDILSEPQHCTISLSQPLPAHAVPWALASGEQHVHQLPFRHKLQLLCTAAASGSEVNLEVALALLQPSIFPEMLRHWRSYHGPDPGVSAVKAGHPQLLGWLLRHCPGLLRPGKVLAAAARHCDLAGLQTAWEALQGQQDSRPDSSSSSSSSDGDSRNMNNLITPSDVFDAAAGSATPDGVAKMEWVVAAAGGSCRVLSGAAEAAARAGDLCRLRWLQETGGLSGLLGVLESALEHADLAVAQWLVDEAGCRLPAAGGRDVSWKHLFQAAAKSPDHLAKWQWLHEQGAPPLHEADREWLAEVVLAAARAGQVGAVRHLLSVFGADRVLGEERETIARAAARSGSVAMVACLREAGLEFSHAAYVSAAASGSSGLPLMRWLAREAGVSAAALPRDRLEDLVNSWPRDTAADSRGLLEAVQLLVGEAGFCNWDSRNHWVVVCAMRWGDLAPFQYLLAQCPQFQSDRYTVGSAANAGCEAMLEWLAERAGPSLATSGSYMVYHEAAYRGDRATLIALRRLGVPWGYEDLVARAVETGCGMPVVRWLVEQGAPLGSAQELEGAVASAVKRCGLGEEEAAWLRGVAAGAAVGAGEA